MVPFKNSDQRRQEEKMIRGWFQISKRNFILKISRHLRPLINFQLSVRCALNNNCFEFISRLFFAWHEHFAGVADGDNFCFLGKKVSPSLND